MAVNPNIPNPQLQPPEPQYRFRWELLVMFGLCLAFVTLAKKVESMYGQWSNFLLRVGIYDHDEYSRFFSLCLLATGAVLIARVWRRSRHS